MHMPWEVITYWICFSIGALYATVTAILGGFFGMVHHAGDIGGGHVDMGHEYGGGHDAGGHGEAFAGQGEMEPVLAPLSPATISVFMTTFGGTGIILSTMFHMNLYYTLPISAASGFIVAAFVMLLFYHLFTKVQASSETRMAEVIGLSAEVTVPIPVRGMGEIAYICRGARLVSPARAESGEELPRHTAVRITRQVGNTLYVGPLPPDAPPPRVPGPGELDAKD